MTISQKDNRKWYDLLFDFSELEVNLYLSQQSIDLLDIEGNIGDIEINQGFTFDSVNIINSTGNVKIRYK